MHGYHKETIRLMYTKQLISWAHVAERTLEFEAQGSGFWVLLAFAQVPVAKDVVWGWWDQNSS